MEHTFKIENEIKIEFIEKESTEGTSINDIEVTVKPIKQEIDETVVETNSNNTTDESELNESKFPSKKHSKLFSCDVCDKKYLHKASLKIHMRNHTREDLFKCSVCHTQFAHKHSWLRHMKLHTKADLQPGKAKYECSECNNKYIQRRLWVNHMLMHGITTTQEPSTTSTPIASGTSTPNINDDPERNQIFTCDICDKKYLYEPSLKKHMWNHKQESLCKCFICHKKFTRKDSWLRHMKTHTKNGIEETSVTVAESTPNNNETPQENQELSCNICDKKNLHKASLKFHLQNHNIQNLYKCSLCNNKFTRKDSWIRHMKLHTRENLEVFACDICDKKYLYKPSLKLHMRNHTLENLFKCSECNNNFTRKDTLLKHMKIHAKARLKQQDKTLYECSKCPNKYTMRFMWSNHMLIHGISVTQEPSATSFESTLSNCNSVEENQSYTCEICYKQFTKEQPFKQHIKNHLNENMFECSRCHKEFKHRDSLKRHMKIHTNKLKMISDTSSEQTWSEDDSTDEIKCESKTMKVENIETENKFINISKNIKVEKIDVAQTATEQKNFVKNEQNLEGTVSSLIPMNSCFGQVICKEEVILSDEND